MGRLPSSPSPRERSLSLATARPSESTMRTRPGSSLPVAASVRVSFTRRIGLAGPACTYSNPAIMRQATIPEMRIAGEFQNWSEWRSNRTPAEYPVEELGETQRAPIGVNATLTSHLFQRTEGCSLFCRLPQELAHSMSQLRAHRPMATGSSRLTRRSFVRAGGLAFCGLTLADFLRLRALAGPDSPRAKSAVLIHLSGGPSHLDMYDMKPLAPAEYRGEFSPVATNVPGIEICELMPLQSRIADKFAILRGAQIANLHTGNMFYSGFPWQESPRASVPGEARRPALGSVVSRMRPGERQMPPYVSIENHFDWERAYYAGVEHEPFRVGGSSPREAIENLGRQREVGDERWGDRQSLLQCLDAGRGSLELGETARGIDRFRERALDIVKSARVRDAFDIEKEPAESRDRYGAGPFRHGPHPGRSLLLARRLLEAGVAVVTVGVHNWDTHQHNFRTLREQLPVLDRALYAFVTDLDERGLLDDVVIVMGGEFGRTPRIGDQTPDGRGHWPEAGFLWVAGGGLHTGQVLGATDARGEAVVGCPISMKNVLATVYRVLGIDPAETIPDHNGRPQVILDERSPLSALL